MLDFVLMARKAGFKSKSRWSRWSGVNLYSIVHAQCRPKGPTDISMYAQHTIHFTHCPIPFPCDTESEDAHCPIPFPCDTESEAAHCPIPFPCDTESEAAPV
ncbi:hypothetical protein RRG08_020140 [Elysia crispata]|uniref:Uncharacterized protein n=1 Tax=Elysia crispata TaxID=231223 RepID=A0AAE1E8D7_9GAST|nr:hypothetical protein RRG08_020140 [Elysia crispata]